MNLGLKDTFEFHVQKRLSGVDGYTQVWQCIGPSLDALALLILVHVEEGSGFSLEEVMEEGVELGLVSQGRVSEVVGMLRQEGLLAGSDEVPRVGVLAQRLMTGLNASYPKMTGILLPAYVVQLLQELSDGRNGLEKALGQVDQALLLVQAPDQGPSIPLEDPSIVKARRDGFLKQIAAIRGRLMADKSQDMSVQAVVPSTIEGAVKTLWVPLEAPSSPSEEVAPSPAVSPDPGPVISSEAMQREAFLEIQREKIELAREREAFLVEKRHLAEEKARSEVGTNPRHSPGSQAQDALTRGESEADIASAVARFEEVLSLACPMCHTGTLETHTTVNGKCFFRCDNRSCGFVTWKRPYPFACPICKNPFLVENDGGSGLSCPRSVCSFTQEGLMPPSTKKGGASGTRRVRRVRRVVRKKK